jgi:hypothetical protein
MTAEQTTRTTLLDGPPRAEAGTTPAELRRVARARWTADRPEAAIAVAWAAYEEQPEDCDGRALRNAVSGDHAGGAGRRASEHPDGGEGNVHRDGPGSMARAVTFPPSS